VIGGDSLVVRATIWLGQDLETTVQLLGVETPKLCGASGEIRDQAARSRAFTTRNRWRWFANLLQRYTTREIYQTGIGTGDDNGRRIYRPGLDRRRSGAPTMAGVVAPAACTLPKRLELPFRLEAGAIRTRSLGRAPTY